MRHVRTPARRRTQFPGLHSLLRCRTPSGGRCRGQAERKSFAIGWCTKTFGKWLCEGRAGRGPSPYYPAPRGFGAESEGAHKPRAADRHSGRSVGEGEHRYTQKVCSALLFTVWCLPILCIPAECVGRQMARAVDIDRQRESLFGATHACLYVAETRSQMTVSVRPRRVLHCRM